MNSFLIDKTIADEEYAKQLVLDYISEHSSCPGTRIFPGDYSSFPVSVTLKMLGFSTSGLKIRKLKCYDEDREQLLNLVDRITQPRETSVQCETVHFDIGNYLDDISSEGEFDAFRERMSEICEFASVYVELTRCHPVTILKFVFENIESVSMDFPSFCSWADDGLGFETKVPCDTRVSSDKRSRMLLGLLSSVLLAMKHLDARHSEMCQLMDEHAQWERIACFAYDYAADGVLSTAESIEAWITKTR